jgi:predicted ATPase/Tfp pilus assembly protein PilF
MVTEGPVEALRIHLLGPLRLRLPEDNTPAFRSNKTRALLAYLAVEAGQPHHRGALAALLWPDLPEDAARNNLSQTLGRLRHALGTEIAHSRLRATRWEIELRLAPTDWLDVAVFTDLVARADRVTDPAAAIPLLEKAVSLYEGELCAGLTVADCQAFEEWLLLSREHLQRLALESLSELADHALKADHLDLAESYARRQLTLDSWQETAHRQLMRALALGGNRAAALAHYEICRQALKEELGVAPDAATEALVAQIRIGELARIEPAGSAVKSAPRHNLPAHLTPLIGRQTEVAEACRQLEEPEARLLTVTGPGGVGKTRLSLAIGERLVGSFKDGVWFVTLADQTDTAGDERIPSVATGVAEALRFTFAATGQPGEQLLRHLRARESLLILDNFEHLLFGPATAPNLEFIISLLQAAPGIKLLVASRERLNLQAERLLILDSLPVPPPHTPPQEVGQFSSARLFVERANRLSRGFRLDAENAGAVARICRATGGLPLALSLASSWIEHFSAKDIATALEDDQALLATSARDVARRHRSIRTTFDYSWRLLTPDEKRLLSQLSIFPADFSRHAALKVAEGKLTDLVSLLGKSLLRQTAAGRYEMHTLIRTAAMEQLSGATNREALGRRYSRYYLDLLATEGSRIDETEARPALDNVQLEWENIRHAWMLALDLDQVDAIEPAMKAMYEICRVRGLFHEAQAAFERMTERVQSMADLSSETRDRLLGLALMRLGRLAYFASDNNRAGRLLDEALAFLRPSRETLGLAQALAYHGELSMQLGDYAAARRHYDEAYSLFLAAGDVSGPPQTLNRLAISAFRAGNAEESDRLFQESLARFHQTGNRRGVARAAHNWGMALIQRNELGLARELLERSLDAAQTLGYELPTVMNWHQLARIDLAEGNLAGAEERLLASMAVAQGTGHVRLMVELLTTLGEVELRRGLLERAWSRYVAGLDLLRGTGLSESVLLCFTGLAELALRVEAPDKALKLLAHVRRYGRDNRRVWPQAKRHLESCVAILPEEEVTRALTQAEELSWEQIAASALPPMPAGDAS